MGNTVATARDKAAETHALHNDGMPPADCRHVAGGTGVWQMLSKEQAA
jgi:hypothetical protein